MTMQVTLEKITVNFSDLIEQVSQGKEIAILKEGQVIARLLPPDPAPRVPGTAIGMITIASDFGDPLPDDILGAFEA
jgi:antitoxin (DNA-binding transcriptional repressor) of toxin-antitoxin stability system